VEPLIRLFNKHKIRYLLIGGQAVRLEGMPRFTMDWDLYIPGKDTENMEKINRLLADELDGVLLPLGPKGENFVQTFQTKWGIVQFHLAGPGLPAFDKAEAGAVSHATEQGVKVRCLSIKDLLKSKEAANRPQDQDDIYYLRQKLKAEEA
jgi:hypothetical protein